MFWCIALRPRPPYTRGQFRPNQPFSPTLRRNAATSPSGYSSPCSAISSRSADVTLARRNSTTLVRHFRSSRSSLKSTAHVLSPELLRPGMFRVETLKYYDVPIDDPQSAAAALVALTERDA